MINANGREFKRYAKKFKNEIEIPDRICSTPGLRLIKIEKDDKKKPAEREFLTKNNYHLPSLAIEGWVRGGGNYGILAGFPNENGKELIIFDADLIERLRELGVLQRLPPTFTVRTGGGGEHRYYWILGLEGKIVLYDPVLKDDDDDYVHLGEIQHRGSYAIGPGSIHRSGKRYEVIDDREIAAITVDQLMEAIAGLRTSKKEKHQRETTRDEIAVKTMGLRDKVDISRICYPLNAKPGAGGEIVGENPIHGHRNKKNEGKNNFSINVSKDVWHCFSCGSGGGWVEWLAVREGIIRCVDAGPNCLTRDQYIQVMRVAENEGLIAPYQPRHHAPVARSLAEGSAPSDVHVFKEFPKIPTPEGMTAFHAAPRNGKTYEAVRRLVLNGEGAYFTYTHVIVEHALKIFRELHGTSAVWVEGMKQPGVCNEPDGNCNTCKKKPNEHREDGGMKYDEMEQKAARLLRENGILTKKEIPADMCPYYTLRAAAKIARYVFTVVNNIGSMAPHKMVVIDEDPALQLFYSPSICVAEIKQVKGEGHYKNNLKNLDIEMKEIIRNGKDKAKIEYAKKILDIFQAIENHGKKSVEDVAEAINGVLARWEPPRKHISEAWMNDEEVSFGGLVRCLGHLYKKVPVAIISGWGGYDKVFLIGDASKPIFDIDWVATAEKVIVIGATLAEMFVREFGGRVWEIPEFRYTDRFIVIKVYSPDRDSRGRHNKQKKMILNIVKVLAAEDGRKRYPVLVLTGSKVVQKHAGDVIGKAYLSTNDGEEDQDWNYAGGHPTIAYQKSAMARGIDIKPYNVIAAYDTNYALPYWRIANPDIADRMISDETTNAVLRISPTLKNDKEMAKVILIPEDDAWKIQYLKGREIDTTIKEKIIGRIIRDLGIPGIMELQENGGTKPIKYGLNYIGAKERMDELFKTTSDVFTEKEIDTAAEIIQKTIGTQKNHAKWYTLNAIEQLTGIAHALAQFAVSRLRFKNLVKQRKRGRSTVWKHKNAPSGSHV